MKIAMVFKIWPGIAGAVGSGRGAGDPRDDAGEGRIAFSGKGRDVHSAREKSVPGNPEESG